MLFRWIIRDRAKWTEASVPFELGISCLVSSFMFLHWWKNCAAVFMWLQLVKPTNKPLWRASRLFEAARQSRKGWAWSLSCGRCRAPAQESEPAVSKGCIRIHLASFNWRLSWVRVRDWAWVSCSGMGERWNGGSLWLGLPAPPTHSSLASATLPASQPTSSLRKSLSNVLSQESSPAKHLPLSHKHTRCLRVNNKPPTSRKLCASCLSRKQQN